MPSVRLPPKNSKPPAKTKKLTKSLKRQKEEQELQDLADRIQNFDLKNPPALFAELPLTRQTKLGLDKAHFKELTDIQRRAIPLALQGKDVLGAAKTGSGKTLAFLIPVLETLYRKKWTHLDGVGALIISPTRELATQIFDVLRKIGREHLFSAGLVIGGKHLREEQEALHRMNIIVCTPGRMLQHMDQTVGANFDNLQMLILDEADRILDMGFRRDVDAIIENLPKQRQTLLFSATQTKNVRDLARLSLKDPEYVAVHESAESATPATLEQFYMTIPLDEKLDTLFAFIRNHLTSKILVFASSCKQVRFIYETFRQLHIGIPLLHLHGKQKQTLRMEITARFTSAKHSCLFATDVVARGLDFPAVDWVVQLDCPEDADTYIHRVGRTARYQKTGRALLFLAPSETKFVTERLTAKKVPIVKVNPKASKKTSIKPQMQSLCFKDPELKYLGQKAFVSYCRSLSIQKDRETFDITQYPLEEFAASMGLPGAPRIKGLKKADADAAKVKKNLPRALAKLAAQPADSDSDTSDEEGGGEKKKPKKKEEKVRTKYDRMVERQNQNVLADHYNALRKDNLEEEDDEANFLTVKRREISPSVLQEDSDKKDVPVVPLGPDGSVLPIDSKRRAKLVQSKKELAKLKPRGHKLVFNEETGEAENVYELIDEEGFRKAGDAQTQRERFLRQEEERRKREEEEDKNIAKEKRRVKKEKRKLREREEAAAMYGDSEDGEDGGVRFEGYVPAPEWSSGAEESENEEDRRRKKRRVETEAVGENLEDLERMALGMLG